MRADQYRDLVAFSARHGLSADDVNELVEIMTRRSGNALRIEKCRKKKRETFHEIVSGNVSETISRTPPAPPINITTSSSGSKEPSEEHPHVVFPTGKDLEEAVDEWNALADMKGLPRVRMLTAERRKSLTARLRELGSIDAWSDVLIKLGSSEFCCGESGWRANFNFVLRKSSIIKILEGNYDNGKNQKREPRVNGRDVFRSSSGTLY